MNRNGSVISRGLQAEHLH